MDDCTCGVCDDCLIILGTRPTDLWEDDFAQFPRLVAEIGAIAESGLLGQLCESMDLSVRDLLELFDRAERRWNQIKDSIVP